MPTVMFVVTTPFAVNAFLVNHIVALSKKSRVILCTNLNAHTLAPALQNGMEVHHIPFSRRVSVFTDLKSLMKLTALIRHVRPAMIQSITPKAGLLAMFSGAICGVPNRIHTFTGQVWATRKGIPRYFLRSVDRLMAALTTDVLVDSESQRQFMILERVVSPRQSRVLAHGSVCGVDLQRFKPDMQARVRIREEYGLLEGDVLLLFVGRLSKEKGLLDLAAAFSGVATMCPNVHLLLVGPDEGEVASLAQQHCGSALLRLHVAGYTDHPESYMAAADIFCLPSYREGFGTVLIEAAAVGIPVVASRIYGIIDAVVEGETGLLHPPADVRALQTALELLIRDPVLRAKLGRFARSRAIEFFSSTKVTRTYTDYILERLSTL